MKEKILFVTKGGEDCDAGFAYVLELAKSVKSGISMLMVYPKQMLTSFEDVMAAAAFAEAGDFKTVQTLMDEQLRLLRETEKQKISEMQEKCREIATDLSYKVVEGDTTAAIQEYLKQSPGIDMVLLSPSLSERKKAVDIKQLIKNISKPIVNISRPAKAGA